MNKSQGRVQAGSVPVRRGGRGGQFTSGGGSLLRSQVSGGTLYYGVVYFVTDHNRQLTLVPTPDKSQLKKNLPICLGKHL